MDLLTNRKMTTAFINIFPVSIVLTPRHKVQQPAGGSVWVTDAPRAPQIVTFIQESASGGTPRPMVTLDGVERVGEMEMLASWDAGIDRFDIFSHQGKDWEVIDKFYGNGYETRAWVSGRG